MRDWRSALREGPPGWLAAWVVTMTVAGSVCAAVAGWEPALRLWREAGGALSAWVGVSLGPWLAYRAIKALGSTVAGGGQ